MVGIQILADAEVSPARSWSVNLTRNGSILGTHATKAKLTSSRGMEVRAPAQRRLPRPTPWPP